jgi:Cyclin, N-terminal domain
MHRNSQKFTPPHKRKVSYYSNLKENFEETPNTQTKPAIKKFLGEASHYFSTHKKHNSLYCEEKIEDISYNALWKCEATEYYKSLEEKVEKYLPDLDYFSGLQENLTPYMRCVLLDWMMEVCAEFTLKRETFYMAVSHLDRFLSIVGPIKKTEFQLVGLVSMYIAAKIEEIFPPKLDDWVKSADEGYSNKAIKAMELYMLRNIHWTVHPPTPFNYINWLMTQWDLFLQYHFGCVLYNHQKDFKNLLSDEKNKQQRKYEKRMILFKASNQQAYKRYRETIQILDASSLEINHILPKYNAAGLLYLMISKYFFESNYELLYYNGPEYKPKKIDKANVYVDDTGKEINGIEFNIESSSYVQELYSNFVNASLAISSIDEIYEAVRYFHPLMDLEIDFCLPVVCKTKSKGNLERHYADFLTFQTHSSKNLEFMSKRNKKS